MLAQKTVVRDVPLKDLVLDKDVQMRTQVSPQAIQDYADAMADGAKFPPVIVYGRVGLGFYVADGFHRVGATKLNGWKTIRAVVKDGGKREAMLYAMKANSKHGVRRRNADKQRAVQSCLADRNWCKWTDSEIAKACDVSAWLVRRLRAEFGGHAMQAVRSYINGSGNLRTRIVRYNHGEEGGRRGKVCPTCKRPY